MSEITSTGIRINPGPESLLAREIPDQEQVWQREGYRVAAVQCDMRFDSRFDATASSPAELLAAVAEEASGGLRREAFGTGAKTVVCIQPPFSHDSAVAYELTPVVEGSILELGAKKPSPTVVRHDLFLQRTKHGYKYIATRPRTGEEPIFLEAGSTVTVMLVAGEPDEASAKLASMVPVADPNFARDTHIPISAAIRARAELPKTLGSLLRRFMGTY